MKPTKAVILAAGKSQRLGAAAGDLPKPLIPLRGKPVIVHNILKCVEAGIIDLCINLHHLPEKVKSALGDGSQFGAKITYHHEPTLLGTAGGVKGFSDELRDCHVLVVYGDNLNTIPLPPLLDQHFSSGADVTVALFKQKDVSGSGVAVCDEKNRILRFVEKPNREELASLGEQEFYWANAGVYLLESRLLADIPEGFYDFGKDAFPKWLAAGVKLVGMKSEGAVTAIDTPELLAAAQKTR